MSFFASCGAAMRHALSLTRWLLGLALLLPLFCIGPFEGRAWAQVPSAEVPPSLRGEWAVAFTSPSTTKMRLTLGSATIVNENGQTIGHLQGKLSTDTNMELKVVLRYAAYEDVPAAVWSEATEKKGDAEFPGTVSTSLTLRYDSSQDEMVGAYARLTIVDQEGKYSDTTARQLQIRLTRVKNPDAYLKIAGPDWQPIERVEFGARFWVEFKPADSDGLKDVTEIAAILSSDDKDFGTKDPIKLTLTKTTAGVFRSGSGGVLTTALLDNVAGDHVTTIYADTVHVDYPDLAYHSSVLVVDHDWKEPEANAHFQLARLSPEVTWIAADRDDHVSVQVKDPAGRPVPGIEIVWRFIRSGLTVSSVTNWDGIAEVYFVPTPTGEYALVADGQKVPDRTLPIGSHEIRADIANEKLKNVTDGVPQNLTVSLERRPILLFLDGTRGNYIDHLLFDDQYQLEVTGLWWAEAEATVELRMPNDTDTATVYRTPKEIPDSTHYLSERSLTAKESQFAHKVGQLTATVKDRGISASIPVYPSWVQYELAQVRAALQFYSQLLDAAQHGKLTAPQLAKIAARRHAISNALRFVDSDQLLDTTKLFIGAAYLDLLAGPPVAFDVAAIVRQTISTPDGNGIFDGFEFTDAAEAVRINQAIAAAQNAKITGLTSLPGEIGTRAYQAVKNLPWTLGALVAAPVTAPIYGGYTLFTGLTLDGERATTFERVMGGVDVVIGAATAISLAYPRLKAALSAVQARRARAAMEGAAALDIPGLIDLTREEQEALFGKANINAEMKRVAQSPRFHHIPGAQKVLDTVVEAMQSNFQPHIDGVAFELKGILNELEKGDIRLVQDRLAGNSQAADLIRRDGTIVQYKSYGRRQLSKLWRHIWEQAESDVRRYSNNEWKDGSGGRLSGNFEWHFDAERMFTGGVTKEKIQFFADELSKWLTYRLNGKALGQFGGQISFKIVATY